MSLFIVKGHRIINIADKYRDIRDDLLADTVVIVIDINKGVDGYIISLINDAYHYGHDIVYFIDNIDDVILNKSNEDTMNVINKVIFDIMFYRSENNNDVFGYDMSIWTDNILIGSRSWCLDKKTLTRRAEKKRGFINNNNTIMHEIFIDPFRKAMQLIQGNDFDKIRKIYKLPYKIKNDDITIDLLMRRIGGLERCLLYAIGKVHKTSAIAMSRRCDVITHHKDRYYNAIRNFNPDGIFIAISLNYHIDGIPQFRILSGSIDNIKTVYVINKDSKIQVENITRNGELIGIESAAKWCPGDRLILCDEVNCTITYYASLQ